MLRTMKHQVLSLTGQEIICRGDKSIKKHWPIFVEMEVLAKVILFRNGWVNGKKSGNVVVAKNFKPVSGRVIKLNSTRHH